MAPRYEVHRYSIDTLERIISERSNNSIESIHGKLHRQYFSGYFNYIKARTIVVENDYIDHDYLEDYSAYYVRCFTPYSRTCTRLHFFKLTFYEQEFDGLLKAQKGGIDCDALAKEYLGFVVIKALPKTVIGRTCLATYPSEERRHFPITRDYHSNLFGIDLRVKTLAFQEQDQTVAACATSALWSVFQGTGKLFQHPIPSPVEITKAATDEFPIETRMIPNRGLSVAMMARAIRAVSLEPYLVNVSDEYILKSTLYAYLRGSIPMILGVELSDTSKTPDSSHEYHAVAATGYSLGTSEPISDQESGFLLRASRIDKIYVHDDQVGPFARMEFDGKTVKQQSQLETVDRDSLSTSWIGSNGEIGAVRALPEVVLIPLYHKIRIPFGVIHDNVISFDEFLETIKEHASLQYEDRLEWDIFLTNVNILKNELICTSLHIGDYFRDVLIDSMPKYIWRASALRNGKLILDLLFDATDIEHGQTLVRAIEYDREFGIVLRAVAKIDTVKNIYAYTKTWKILQWFHDAPIEI